MKDLFERIAQLNLRNIWVEALIDSYEGRSYYRGAYKFPFQEDDQCINTDGYKGDDTGTYINMKDCLEELVEYCEYCIKESPDKYPIVQMIDESDTFKDLSGVKPYNLQSTERDKRITWLRSLKKESPPKDGSIFIGVWHNKSDVYKDPSDLRFVEAYWDNYTLEWTSDYMEDNWALKAWIKLPEKIDRDLFLTKEQISERMREFKNSDFYKNFFG